MLKRSMASFCCLVTASVLLPASAPSEDTPVEKITVYKREVKKMGTSINQGLGVRSKSIRKTKYPYAARSFSARTESTSRSLREAHESAFAAREEACERKDSTEVPDGTNVVQATAEPVAGGS
jgi:hypothetical protein